MAPNGPELIWKADGIGDGYSSPSVVKGRIYIAGNDDKRMEFVSAFDLAGKLLWKREYGPAWAKKWHPVRTTPTVDGDKLYVISGSGVIACLAAKTGEIIWKLNGLKTFEGDQGRYGTSESPAGRQALHIQ